MFTNYFVFLWKKNKRPLIILFMIFFTMFPLIVLFTKAGTEILYVFDSNKENIIEMINYTAYTSTNLYMATISIMVFAYIIPIYLNRIFYKKAAIDLYFSLPVKKVKMVSATYIFGFLSLFVTWLISFILGCIFAAILKMPVRFIEYFYYVLSMIGISFFAYSISFFFSKVANNITDAIGLNILVIMLPMIFIELGLSQLLNYSTRNLLINSISPIFVANNFTTYFEKRAVIFPALSPDIANIIEIPEYFTNGNPFTSTNLISIIVSILFGGLLLFLSFREGIVFKGELAGERTIKVYGFKIIYPLFMLPFFISNFSSIDSSIGLTSNVIGFIFLVVCYFVFYFVIKRKIKVDKELLISFSIVLLLSIIVSLCYKFLIQ